MRSYPGVLSRVLREVRDADLVDALDAASAEGLTLGEYVERRTQEIRDQLVRDAAPQALRELRRLITKDGVA